MDYSTQKSLYHSNTVFFIYDSPQGCIFLVIITSLLKMFHTFLKKVGNWNKGHARFYTKGAEPWDQQLLTVWRELNGNLAYRKGEAQNLYFLCYWILQHFISKGRQYSENHLEFLFQRGHLFSRIPLSARLKPTKHSYILNSFHSDDIPAMLSQVHLHVRAHTHHVLPLVWWTVQVTDWIKSHLGGCQSYTWTTPFWCVFDVYLFQP